MTSSKGTISIGYNIEHIFIQNLVPPKWLLEPNDYSVERNKNVAMHCQAQGVPTPVVVWKKTKGLSFL